MDKLHHVRRQIGADRNGGKIERAKSAADFLEQLRIVARIPREEKLIAPSLHSPSRP
jgi:hypothetical protein